MMSDIEKLTGRRLLVAFSHPDMRPKFRSRDQEGFAELLSDLDPGEPYDLMIESPGGETDVAESIITMLQRAGGSFRVIVPGQAKSNATLLALASDEIVMLPSSEIGPIDPILGGKPANVLIDPRLRDSDQLDDRIIYTTASDALEHTRQIATKLLHDGMMRKKRVKIAETVAKLCQAETPEENGEGGKREFYSHSATICAKQARLLHLKIAFEAFGSLLERKLVYLHAMYAQDCRNIGYDKLYETTRVSNLHFYERD